MKSLAENVAAVMELPMHLVPTHGFTVSTLD